MKGPLLLPHSLHQGRRRRLQRPGDFYQVQHGDIALAALHGADVGAVEAGLEGESFLIISCYFFCIRPKKVTKKTLGPLEAARLL